MVGILCDMSGHLATSSLARLSNWFASSLGKRLLTEQGPLIGESARRFHGDTLLWVGCHTPLVDTVRGCMIRNHLFLQLPDTVAGAESETPPDMTAFESNLEQIPLPNKSLDGIVVHHALETAQDPRTAIRELSRTLAPGGRLIVCAFNPISMWGIRAVYARLVNDSFSDLRFISAVRLVDWLTVLGFELQHKVKYVAYGLPFPTGESDSPRWRKVSALLARHRLPIGGVYVVSAVKQAMAERPDWRKHQLADHKLTPVAYPKTIPRIGVEDSG